MKTYWLKRFILIAVLGLSTTLNAQITVTPNLTALQLAEIFAGSNLTVSNAVLTGSPTAAGSFTSSNGFEYTEGIVLCTGLATSAAGPNNDPNTGDNLGQPGNLLLEALGGAASKDAVVLEFDFVVQSPSVQFEYIFASEEYPEFAPPNQPDFTDVFAFYISGPGITGEENIALIPGTSLAVNIQNVNAVTNQLYYRDNTGGQEIQFDGYTTSLVASKGGLIPCQTYHLKLAISDIKTLIRNSGVFLKANSFVQESTLDVSSQTIQADNTAREGCVRGSFTFEIPAPEATDRVIDFTVSGTAVNGVDYRHIDNSVIIPAGDTIAVIYIDPYSDGLTEGQETVVLDFTTGGCGGGTGTTSMFIDDAQPINFTLDHQNLDCFEDNSGEITVNASGGFPPYTFTYINDQGTANTANTSPITGLAAGQYTVRVEDAYGCRATALVVGGIFNAGTTFLPDGTGVTYEAPLNISGFGTGDVITNVNQVQQVCLTLEHSYMGDLTIDLVSPSGQVVALKGFGGSSDDLGEPVATGPFDDGLSSDATPGIGYEYCFNANPTFGTMNSEIGKNFRTGYTDVVGNVYDDFYMLAGSYAPDGNFSSLIGSTLNGDWKIRVTDNAALDNGYIFNWYISLIGDLPDSVVVLTQPQAIGINGVSQNASCGNPDGGINTTISNAIDPYTVSWSNGAVTEDLTGLNAGTYTITVTDANTCTETASFNVSNTSSIGISALVTGVTCYNGADGAIDLTVTGGLAPYNIAWSNGSNNEDLSGLSPGTYAVTVTDANGCIKIQNVTVPNASQISIALATSFNEQCGTDNGSIAISVSGGSGSYAYAWNNGANTQNLTGLTAGSYTVTVTDGLSCSNTANFSIINDISNCSSFCFLDATVNSQTDEQCGQANGALDITLLNAVQPVSVSWNNGSLTEDITALAAGDYTVTVTDANACTISKTFTIVNNTGDLAIAGSQTTDEQCGNAAGAIDITVSGGTAPYNFSWSNAAMTEDLTGLTAGNYAVQITDANGCTLTQNFTVNSNAGTLAVSGTSTQTFCSANNGTITQTVTGAIGTISYLWSNLAVTQNLSNLAAGNYTCTISDQLGCSVQKTYTVTSGTGNIQLLSTNTNSEVCGNGLGSIDLTASGTGLTYAWSTGAVTEDLSGLSVGDYSCVITNDQGCSLSTGIIHVGNSTGGLNVITQSLTNELCGTANGAIDVSISGGTSPYTIGWSNGAVTEDLTALNAGIYTITINDVNGCVKSVSLTVNNDPGTLALSAPVITPEACGNHAGAIDITVSGGTIPYTFAWSNGAVTEDLTGIESGNYSVVVTDAGGCSVSSQYTVGPAAGDLAISGASLTHDLCGKSTGAINLTVTGGSSPYSYSWSNGAVTQDISGLSAGSYSITVTDADGCNVVATYAISNNTGTLAVNGVAADETCGSANGSINITTTGGTAPIGFSWNSGQLTEDLTAISAGNYVLTATDALGCFATFTATIANQTNGLALSLNAKTDENCGQADGSIDLNTATTGTVTYLWSNGAVTEDITGLAAGTYTVTATDDLGCSLTYSETITNQTGSLAITFTNTNQPLCGNNDGFIDIEVAGSGPFTYAWSNGEITQDITALTSGTYSVTITDNLGCTLTQSFDLNASGANMILSELITDANCGTPSGAINLTVLNGTSPYTFLWSNGAVTEDVTGLAAGSYSVQVTDFFGCQATKGFTINTSGNGLVTVNNIFIQNAFCDFNNGQIFVAATNVDNYYLNGILQPGGFFQNLSPATYTIRMEDINGCYLDSVVTVGNDANFSLSSVVTDETCGQGNGAINLTATDLFGQGLIFNYVWSNGPLTEDISNLNAGSYTVTVTDDFGCTLTHTATVVNQSGAFQLSASNVTPSTCGTASGAIDITITGGAMPLTYAWSNGAATEDISGLVPGTYSVTVTDATSCAINQTFTINNSFSISGVVTDATCSGSNGAVNLTVSGGQAPFTFAWSNGAATEDISALPAGTYDVTVTDNASCTASASFTVNEINNVTIFNIGTNDEFCNFNDGSIFVNAIGVNRYYINGVEDFGLGFFQNLSTGTYTIGLEDLSGCVLDTVITVGNQGNFELTSLVTDETCGQSNGAINVTANDINGFGLVFTYSWNTGAVSEDLSGLQQGTYTVQVTDNFGCTMENTGIVQNQAGTLAISNAIVTPADCGAATGSVDITVSGGTGPYTYSWSDGSLTEDLTNVAPGTYTVEATDAANCTVRETYVITNSVLLSGTVSNPGCGVSNGSIDLTVNGGVAPYVFVWSNGSAIEDLSALAPGTYSVDVTDNTGCTVSASFTLTEQAGITLFNLGVNPDFCSSNQGSVFINAFGVDRYFVNGTEDFGGGFIANLSAGTYTITLMDAAGCTLDTVVTIANQGNFTISAVVTDENCGQGDGAIDITTTDFGFGLTYTYSWNNGAATEDISNLSAGDYTISVTDNFGCTLSQTETITNQTGGFGISAAIITQSNCGTPTGAIDLTISGGVQPYTYSWSNGAATEDITALAPGTYTVDVTDAANCSFTQSYVIDNSFQVTGVVSNALCPNNNGSIDLSVNSGVAPYTFVWSNGAITEDITNLAPGTYSVQVTDNVGCATTASFTVIQQVGINLFNVSSNPDFCGFGFGSIFLNGTGIVNYYIDGVQDFNGGFFQNLTNGSYLITLEDANGCTLDTNVVVGNQGNFTITAAVTDETCGQGNGAINITPNDIFAQGLTYTYSWDNGANTQDLFSLSAGTYTISITDDQGCTLTSTSVVNNLTGSFQITAANVQTSTCGAADGSIDITVSGGVQPYTFNWSNGAVTEDISGLAPGTYSVTIDDNTGCQLAASYTINNSFVVSGVAAPASCGASNGSIDLSMTTGTAPYTYVWSNGAVTEDLTGLAAGDYTVTVTDALGCSATATFTVGQLLSFTLNGNSIQLQPDYCNAGFGSIDVFANGTVNDYLLDGVSNFGSNSFQGLTAGTYLLSLVDNNGCQLDTLIEIQFGVTFTPTFAVTDDLCGAGNGAINLEVSDDFGIGIPFTYVWSTGAVTQDLSNLSAGTYSVQITQDLTQIIGTTCQNSYSVIVNTAAGFSLTPALTDENCTSGDGAIDLTISGGAGLTIGFSWNNGALTEDISGLSAGTYTVVATDQNGCSLTQSYTINRLSTLTLNGAVIQNENCGLADGSINLTVTGTNPITYAWSNAAVTEDISGLASGNYTVIITDANSCIVNQTFAVGVETGLSITALTIESDTCAQGVGGASLTVTGTVANYYLDGALVASGVYDGLTAGNHTLSLENSAGCRLDTLINVPNHSTFTIAGVVTNEICGNTNGAINLTVTGGVSPFVFTWDNGQNVEDLTALAAGTYQVNVTDAAGCQQSATFTLINNTGTLSLDNAQINQAYCSEANGSIDLTISGGTTPYQIVWSNGAVTEDLVDLAAGTYSVTITDASGCKLNDSFTVSVISTIAITGVLIQEDNCSQGTGSIFIQTAGGVIQYTIDGNTNPGPSFTNLNSGTYTIGISDGLGCALDTTVTVISIANFALIPTIKPEGCGADNGFVHLAIDSMGQTLSLSYLWSNGAITQDVNGLTKGNYSVTVTNSDGCALTQSFFIDSLTGVFDVPTLTATNASCISCADGSVTVSIANPGSYTYAWSNGAVTADQTGLLPGSYTLTITNAAGCDTTVSVTIGSDQSDDLIFVVGPNPANGEFTITINFPNGEKGRLLMYDIIGQLVYESPEMNSGVVNLTANQFSAATYFVAARSVSVFERIKFEIIK